MEAIQNEKRFSQRDKLCRLIANATKYSCICIISKKDKLVERFMRMPADFHYNEMKRLLGYYGFREESKGKTSGSRVKFVHSEGRSIYMHKPHPNGLMKQYQLKQVKEILEL